MNTLTDVTTNQGLDQQGYVQRNSRWLAPLAAAFIVIAIPALLETFKDIDPKATAESGEIMSKHVAAGVALTGLFLAGLGAQFTNTTSALIFKRIVGGVSLAVVLYYVVPLLLGR